MLHELLFVSFFQKKMFLKSLTEWYSVSDDQKEWPHLLQSFFGPFASAWRVFIQMLVNSIVVSTNAIRFISVSSVPNLDFMQHFLIANPVEEKSEGDERRERRLSRASSTKK